MSDLWKDCSLRDLDGEHWKQLIGTGIFDEFYLISDLGRVKSLDRVVNAKNNSFLTMKGVTLKQKLTKNGYLNVCLAANSQKKHFRVHRLVGFVWIPNPNNLPEINHKKGIKTDNRACELEWSDKSENEKHAYRNGLKTPSSSVFTKDNIGSKNIRAIKIDQLTLDGQFVNSFHGGPEAERHTGINYKAINRVLRKKSKSSGGFLWRYSKPTINNENTILL